MTTRHFPRSFAALVVTTAAAFACSERPDDATATQVTAPAEAVLASSQPAPGAVRESTGLSHIPTPVDREAFNTSIDRHYPAALRSGGVSGRVLVDVSLDERGVVRDVKIAEPPPQTSHPTFEARLQKRDPKTGIVTERAITGDYDSRFGPAAVAVLRETKFTAAVRDGMAVPFSFRMTIAFAPPSDRNP